MLTAIHVQSSVSTAAPSAAGTTAPSAGTRRPRSPGTHRGNTSSPQVETNPTAVNASNSETMDSRITYSRSGTPGTPDEVTSETTSPRTIGAWKVHAAIRHALEGSTVNGTAQAATRAHRGTPAAGACAAAQAAGIFVAVVIPSRCRATAARSSLPGVNPLPPAREASTFGSPSRTSRSATAPERIRPRSSRLSSSALTEVATLSSASGPSTSACSPTAT